jgi:small-conductance mechanosensitive channel
MANGIDTQIIDVPLSLFDTINSGTVIYIISIIVIAWLLVKITGFALKKISGKFWAYRSVVTTLIPLLQIVIYAAAIYYIVTAVIEPSLNQLVAFFGLFGAALGFGLKDIFGDIAGGIVITFEKPYQIGDKVTISEHYGEVVDIGIRSTRIVTPDDSIVSLPNYFVFSQPSSSANAGKPEMMVVIDVYTNAASDSVLAMKILKDAVITSKFVYISEDRPYTVLVEDFPYYRRIRAKAYVNDLRSEFEFRSEVTRRVWVEYAREGIRAPEPVLLRGGAKH